MLLYFIYLYTHFFPLKLNNYSAFYFWHRRYRRLPPSGSKQEKQNFVTNIKSGLFIKFEIDWIKNGWNRKVWLLITIFMLLLVNNVLHKMRTRVTNTISLYKLTNALLLLICFKLVMKSMKIVNFKIYFHFSKNIFGMLKT